MDEKLFGRVVYGSGDDAALSDFFGLESPFSRRAEEMREELASLEYAVATGRADAATMNRFRALRRELATSQFTRVDELDIGAGRRGADGS